MIKNEFSALLTLRVSTIFKIGIMVYCHGLLSQITFDWCYQYWNYGLLLDGFLRHENIKKEIIITYTNSIIHNFHKKF